MKRMAIYQLVFAGLAAANLAFPHKAVVAAEQTAKVAAVSVQKTVKDVSLASSGTMQGRVVNARGQALEGSVVTIQQAGKPVAQTVTNARGEFAVAGLKGGVYHVQAGDTTGVFRAWTARTAPPAAAEHALLVTSEEAINGQDYCPPESGTVMGVDPTLVLLTAGVIAGVALGAVAVAQNNDIKDELAKIPKSP